VDKSQINLVPFTANDFDTLLGWIDSKEFHIQWCGNTFKYPLDIAQLEEYLKDTEGEHASKRVYKALTQDGRHIGNISLHRIEREKGIAGIACVIVGDKMYRGRGVGEIVVRKLLNISFNEIGLKEVYLNVFEYNKTAIRCYEKCGFKIVSRYDTSYGQKTFVNCRMEINSSDLSNSSDSSNSSN